MTWLSPYFAIIDSNAKTLNFANPWTNPLVWVGDYISTQFRTISFLCSLSFVGKGLFNILVTSQG